MSSINGKVPYTGDVHQNHERVVVLKYHLDIQLISSTLSWITSLTTIVAFTVFFSRLNTDVSLIGILGMFSLLVTSVLCGINRFISFKPQGYINKNSSFQVEQP